MGFINITDFEPIEPVPGCRMRTPFGKNMMLSYLEMDEGAEVPMHSHPHEQGGMLIQGTLELTIGDEVRLCQQVRRSRRLQPCPRGLRRVDKSVHSPAATDDGNRRVTNELR